MPGVGTMTLVVVGILVLLLVGIPAMFASFYKKVEQGQALIINKMGSEDVTFTGGMVLPVVHKAETMEISVKTVEIDRRGKEGLICKDNIRADIKVTFFVRVNKTKEDVLKVAQSVGCARASDQDKIEELFAAKFSEALKTVGKQLDFEELYGKRVEFRERIIQVIGEDLNGYVLEDAAIDYLEQTPVEDLEDDNVLDSHGIRKITEITSVQRVQTNELSNQAEKDIGKDNLETKKALLEYERQEADAEAKQQREIKVVKSQQHAQAEEVAAQENARAEKARIEAEEEVESRRIAKQRELEVADKNRERVVAVEEENVKKERQLQVIARERETDLKSIEADKEIEVEKKEIAEVKRDRISVEKTVAEEEENIAELRMVKEAERKKEASVIEAEAEAEQKLIADIKSAEAKEQVAKHEAREQVTRADAEVDAAERIAEAKKRKAEGVQAEQAAPGLAEVQVKEADAQADEKKGMVEAKVTKEQMLAEAAGEEEQGMVEIRLTEKRAEATKKEGLAEAEVTREKMAAEAQGLEEQEMVEVNVREKNAAAIEKEGLAEAKVKEEQGMVDIRLTKERAAATEREGEAEAKKLADRKAAEAQGIRDELAAEADGIREKAEAMASFDDETMDHEEFRLELEQQKELDMARIGKSVDIMRAQAEVMGEAFKAADINVVGGDGAFYDKFIKSVSAGQMLDGFMDQSATARNVFDRVVNGENDGSGANGAGETITMAGDGDVTGRSLTDVLSALQDEADGESAATIQQLIERVQNTPLDELGGGSEEA